MIFFHQTVRIAMVSGLVAFATCTPAQNTSSNNVAALTSRLSGASEVPPTDTSGKGDFQATLDKASRTLKWTLAVTALSGPPTGAAFHGPAAPGENGSVAVTIPVTGSPTDNGVVTRWDDDPALIPLTSHRLITIQIGTQLTELPNFVWTGT